MAVRTHVSLDEFLAIPDIDEQRLELIDGEVCEKVSPRWGHGALAIQLGIALDPYGYVAAEPRAIIPRGPDYDDSAPLPDVAFYRDNPPLRDDWMRRPPDIAVEILSPGQSRREVRAKVDIYLGFGVRSVWVFDLERESVDVHEGGERRTLSGEDVLTTPAIPEFSIAVESLFASLPPRSEKDD